MRILTTDGGGVFGCSSTEFYRDKVRTLAEGRSWRAPSPAEVRAAEAKAAISAPAPQRGMQHSASFGSNGGGNGGGAGLAGQGGRYGVSTPATNGTGNASSSGRGGGGGGGGGWDDWGEQRQLFDAARAVCRQPQLFFKLKNAL